MRSQGRPLAGVAALLGLALGGAGCESALLPRRGDPAPAAPGERVVSMGRPAATRQTFSIFRTSPRGTRQATPSDCALCKASSVEMMRPVALPGKAIDGGVQPVAGEVPVISTTGAQGEAFASLERPLPSSAPTDKPEGGRLLPTPTPLPGRDETPTSVGPPPRKVPDREVLPDRRATGYPELPPRLITHPIEAPREGAKRALAAYVIEPPDVVLISGPKSISDTNQDFQGQNLVRPDGSIGFGSYPSIFVAGMTIEQAKVQVARAISLRLTKLSVDEILKELRVDVVAYNSKFVYVVTDGGGYGEQVIRLPYTGNETVLDAIAQIQGLPAVASKKRIWVARATPSEHAHPNILPVDWCGIAQRGETATNYQLYPADRIYVHSDPKIRLDSRLAKVLAPIERVLGVTLLGSSTVNSIRNGNNLGNFPR